MSDLYAVAALFRTQAGACDAARRATDAGWTTEAFTPYPVDGLPEALKHDDPWIARWVVIGAVVGFFGFLLLQVYSVAIDYPINIGGRALISWEAFAVPAFEIGVLASATCGFGAMLWRNRLPRLHHPVFGYSGWHHVSGGGFVVCLLAEGTTDFPADRARRFLEEAGGMLVEEVPA